MVLLIIAFMLPKRLKIAVCLSGEGKSRITTYSTLVGLDTGLLNKVHLVFDNDYLRKDKRLQRLWKLAEC